MEVEQQETNQQYHADTTRLSNSMLSILKRSPKLFYGYYVSKSLSIPESTESMALGSMVHTMLLEPQEFENRYAVCPPCDRRTTVGKKIHADFLATLGPKTELVKHDDMMLAAACCEAMHSHADLTEVIEATWDRRIVEQRIDFQVAGVDMRCKPDYLSIEAAVVVDVKTTKDASPIEFAKSIAGYGYHRQAWLYQEAVYQKHNIACRFIFAVVCTEPPFEVACYELSDAAMAAGGREVFALLDEFRSRSESGDWISEWSRGIVPIELPTWYRG